MAESRPRNTAFEREVTREACRGILDPEALVVFAEARAAVRGEYGVPSAVRLGRNLLREALEELADARNYLVWWLEDNLEDPGVPQVMSALREVAVAFARISDSRG